MKLYYHPASTWKKVNEAIDGFGASLKGQPMVAV